MSLLAIRLASSPAVIRRHHRQHHPRRHHCRRTPLACDASSFSCLVLVVEMLHYGLARSVPCKAEVFWGWGEKNIVYFEIRKKIISRWLSGVVDHEWVSDRVGSE